MKAIAAMAENRAIGRDNKLPWHPIKEDFKFFKEFTTNKILVVGRKTFDTLPRLRDRNIIVLSYQSEYKDYSSFYDPNYNTGVCYMSEYNISSFIKNQKQDQIIIIGGASVYAKFMPMITEFYVTHVKGEYEADTFMPTFEHLFSKQELVREFDGHRVIKYSK
jgi:dihydrofolate reductase